MSEQVQPRSIPGTLQLMMKAKGLLYMPYTLLKIILACSPKHDLHCTDVSGKKYMMWSKPISMRLIKAIKHKLQVSINDILVGCIATSLHEYFKEHNKSIPDEIMTGFPFNTRNSLKEAETFANRFAVVFLPIPIKCPSALENVIELNRRMRETKYSGEHHGMRYAARILNYALPFTLNQIIFGHLSSYSSLVLSNVPGPQVPITLEGTSVQMTCFWPPQKKNIGMGASILSYHGELRIAFCCDASLKTKPEELLKRFPDVFQSLAETIGVDDLHNSE